MSGDGLGVREWWWWEDEKRRREQKLSFVVVKMCGEKKLLSVCWLWNADLSRRHMARAEFAFPNFSPFSKSPASKASV